MDSVGVIVVFAASAVLMVAMVVGGRKV